MLGGEMVVKWDFTHDVHATCRAHTELVELGVVLADGFRTCGLIIARVAVLVLGQVYLENVGLLNTSWHIPQRIPMFWGASSSSEGVGTSALSLS